MITDMTKKVHERAQDGARRQTGPAGVGGTERECDDLLLNVLDEFGGLLGHVNDEVAGAGVDERVETSDVLAAANKLGHETAVLAELLAIGEKSKGAVPAHELAADGDNGAGRVDGAALVQQLESVLGAVEDNVGLAEEGDRGNVACGTRGGTVSALGEFEDQAKEQTPALAPLREGAPFVAGGHVEHVADDGEALGAGGEGPGGLLGNEAVQKIGSDEDGNAVKEGGGIDHGGGGGGEGEEGE